MKILAVITLLVLLLLSASLMVIARRLSNRCERLENDILVNKSLYDSLEELISKQYEYSASLKSDIDSLRDSVDEIKKKQAQ